MTPEQIKARIKQKFGHASWFCEQAKEFSHSYLCQILDKEDANFDWLIQRIEELQPVKFKLKQPELHQALKEAIAANGLTTVELADIIGLKLQHLANAIRAKNWPNPKLAMILKELKKRNVNYINIQDFYKNGH